MRSSSFVVLLALVAAAGAAAGCKHPGSAKLEGRWKGERAEGVSAEMQANADVFATESEIVVKGNQISISTPAGKGVTATYFVDKEDAASVVLHTDKDATSETFTFEGADKIAWKVDERRSIVFKKVE